MLNKGVKCRLTGMFEAKAEIYRSSTGAGYDSHIAQVLYGRNLPFRRSEMASAAKTNKLLTIQMKIMDPVVEESTH